MCSRFAMASTMASTPMRGAEQFTQPGYERYWDYVREFNLAHVYYPRRENILRWIGGRMHTPEMLADPKVLEGLGLNRREIAYLADNPFPELAGLYFAPYVDSFADEYKPFDAGLNDLDRVSTTELFRKDGASPAALGFIGGSGSALESVWHAAILKRRGVPLFPPKVYRLIGGNQTLTDTFAQKLGDRVRLSSPVTAIEHGQTGVRVSCKTGETTTRLEADYLVCAMSARMLRVLPVTPAWPAAKMYAISNVPYYHDTRVVFQSRTRFWERDGVSPNMEFGDPALFHVWSASQDVQTSRGLLAGTASGPGTAAAGTGHLPQGTIRVVPRTSKRCTSSSGRSIPGPPPASGRRTCPGAREVLARADRAVRSGSTSSAHTPTT